MHCMGHTKVLKCHYHHQWPRQKFSLGGYSPVGLGAEVSQCSPRAKSPPKAEAVCRRCLQILTAHTITIWKFRINHRLIFDQSVSRAGVGLNLGHDLRCHWSTLTWNIMAILNSVGTGSKTKMQRTRQDQCKELRTRPRMQFARFQDQRRATPVLSVCGD